MTRTASHLSSPSSHCWLPPAAGIRGRDVGVKTSFGASGEQSRAVEGGLKADIVSFSIEPDVERLVEAGLVAKDWKAATPTKGGTCWAPLRTAASRT